VRTSPLSFFFSALPVRLVLGITTRAQRVSKRWFFNHSYGHKCAVMIENHAIDPQSTQSPSVLDEMIDAVGGSDGVHFVRQDQGSDANRKLTLASDYIR
jgi:hypothetical protein